MKKITVLLSLFSSLALSQGSVFKQFDVTVYPEYYFTGIMVEVNGTMADVALPVDVEISVPANTDSVFYVPGIPEEESKVIPLNVLSSDGRHFIRLNIQDETFRAFIFYAIEQNGHERSGTFTFQVNQYLEDTHLIIQEPVVAENFSISDTGAEPFDDQHGITFHRLHLHDLQPGALKTISFSYTNPTGETSILQLQKMLSGGSASSKFRAQSEKPQRHTLPLWQPLAVLAVLAVVVGGLFNAQKKRDNASPAAEGKFCRSCGKQVNTEQKFCASCGGKL